MAAGQRQPARTIDPSDDDDFSDLAPLREIVGAARIVGIGESTHRIHEFYQVIASAFGGGELLLHRPHPDDPPGHSRLFTERWSLLDPEGLDELLAGSGLPRFLLDLRKVPDDAGRYPVRGRAFDDDRWAGHPGRPVDDLRRGRLCRRGQSVAALPRAGTVTNRVDHPRNLGDRHRYRAAAAQPTLCRA